MSMSGCANVFVHILICVGCLALSGHGFSTIIIGAQRQKSLQVVINRSFLFSPRPTKLSSVSQWPSVSAVEARSTPTAMTHDSTSSSWPLVPQPGYSRSAFFRNTIVAVAAVAAVAAGWATKPGVGAAEDKTTVDPALMGTKKDPAYESCVSNCLYDCTKPKGLAEGQKSRRECLPECKATCATTKQQLMIGTPIKK